MRFLPRLLISVLASLAIAWAPTAFSAQAATGGGLSITLSPEKGPPRTRVHVGFGSCVLITTSPGTTPPDTTDTNPTGPTTPSSVSSAPGPRGLRGLRPRVTSAPGTITYVRWDGHDLPFTPSVTDGTGSAEFQVPDGATVGPHPVTAGCDNGSLVVDGSGTFTVTATDGGGVTTPTHRPLIALDPSQGRPGASLRVHGAGFDDCVPSGKPDTVELSTNGQIHARVGISPGTGTFEAALQVNDNAPAGDYTMAATCAGHPDVHAEATFTVLPADEGRPVLVLDPTAGASKTAVTATGSGFNCSKVEVAWDDGTALAVTAVSGDGTFATDFQVPPNTSAAKHTVRAACTPGSGTSAETEFSVTNAGTSPGGTSSATGGGTNGRGTSTPVGWVVGPSAFGAVLLAVAAASVLLNHRHPGPRWVRKHISTKPRPGAETAALHQQPGTGSANRTVRFEPHADPGDQSLE
ncbi:hypothetical protein BFF78_29570 [Streptomyces fodineus]|uniref:IPT/TIG domain-containing protein n=1 Tax=Streptomyces fodineus TaxID=1904616 RepID=A0A1D7YH24_9ACTN|nr:hypothetical protein BFF78_29570 [Streptomyces fodineus]